MEAEEAEEIAEEKTEIPERAETFSSCDFDCAQHLVNFSTFPRTCWRVGRIFVHQGW